MSLNGLGELMSAVGLAVLLVGEWKDQRILCFLGKPFASIGFIVAAVGFGALESRYGKTVLAGLVLGAIGDVCLLGRARRYFIAGLISFLLGHVAYVVAFGSLPTSLSYALVAGVAMSLLMFFVARWVFPHAVEMRVPIGIYMLVIAGMCIVAVGGGGAGAPWMVPVGALMFTASDIAVVRDRFVTRGFVNRLWGLPLYYAAQLVIAWSIAAVNP
jgi:uncharacterized membrane protein YhhN